MRPDSDRNKQVIFLGASWHSGSTILGLLLGANDEILYCGEGMCAPMVGDPSAPVYQRWCRLCGSDCPVWQDWPGRHEDGLYEYLSQRTGRRRVFDSSKSVTWVRTRARRLPDTIDARLLLLSRDGRAVVNSHARKQPGTSVAEYAASWVKKMDKIETMAAAWDGRVHRVRYEELITEPASTLRRLCDGLGVEYQSAMTVPWHAESHPLDANPGPLLMLMRERGQQPIAGVLDATTDTSARYLGSAAALTLDLRWKEEMGRDALRVFDQIAGETNRRYAW